MPASTPATSLPAIQIDHVSRHYPMGESSIRAVDDVSLVVPAGEFLALLGSSGSGKSTLLNLMAGLDRPTSGSIVSGGRSLAELSPLELARYRRNTVGMVFQSFNLLPRMTLEENVELPLRLAEVERGNRGACISSGHDSSDNGSWPMKLRDMTELALRNLREAILRNSLTTLGVAVGVASLVAMLSLGVGLQQLASSRLAKSGLFDSIFVTPKTNLRRPGGGPPATRTPDARARPLDADARAEISHLPNVIEVYPQIRFFTEVRYEGKPFATMVAGMPESSKSSGAFDGMQGSFYSSPNADETILQAEFAKELNPQTASLIGKDLILRYAERQSLAAQPGEESSGGFSVVPKDMHLRIIGVVETEPASGFGGFGSGRLLIPLPLAETLRAAQVNDLRDILRDSSSDKPTYSSLTVRVKSPALVEATERS